MSRTVRRTCRTRIALSLAMALALAACGESTALVPGVGAFKVTLSSSSKTGGLEPKDRLPFSTSAVKVTVDIEAQWNDGRGGTMTSYNGWVVLSVQPTGLVDGRSFKLAQLKDGQIKGVEVSITHAFGPVRIVASDDGYVKAADSGNAKCNNGRDDDGDGLVDSSYDPGCLQGDDDTEEMGSGASGASAPIYFASLRLADIQTPDPTMGLDASPVDGQQVDVEDGFMLVSRVTSDGFYVTDFSGATWDSTAGSWTVPASVVAYRSMFVFNFSAPAYLQPGDCLVRLTGAVSEFYGYTEIGMPTWQEGDFAYCAQLTRAAGVTDCPTDNSGENTAQGLLCRQRMESLASSAPDITLAEHHKKTGTEKTAIWSNPLWVEPWEAGVVRLSNVSMFSTMVSCDTDGSGKISSDEWKTCTCDEDQTCAVKESYNQYKQWSVNFKDADGATVEVAVISTGALPDFDPVKASAKIKTLDRVVGTLRHFMYGTPPWILELRSASDCPQCVN